MRVTLAAVLSVSLTPVLLSQTYDWRQSPTTGSLYAVTQPMTWLQARAQAMAVGGDLAIVRSAAEQAWLFDQFGSSQSRWLGLTDSAVEGTFVWVDGTPATFTDWAPGQPDNQGGAENWVAMSPQSGWPLGSDGQWRDESAQFVCPAIMQLDPAAVGRVVTIGTGCAGSNGTPALAAIGGAPVPGSMFPVRFDQLPTTPTVLLTALGLGRLGPLDLTPFGLPGCLWHTQHFGTTVQVSPGTGTFQWSFLIANSPVLRGVQIRLQGAIIDPPANAAGITITNALAMVYGQGVGEVAMVENFLSDTQLNRAQSGGSWSGGTAVFSSIGGNGLHGTFAANEIGTLIGVIGGLQTFEIDTDNAVIPAANTLTGAAITVTDGRFFFTDMTVPADTRVRFVGSAAPQITVAGKLEVLGEIDVQGETLAYPTSTVVVQGQAGGRGGPFGGAGGKGGNKCLGVGPSLAFEGEDGEAANVLAGRAYAATAAGTGGRGSRMLPASGLISSLFFAPGTVTYTPDASAGGGGGGLLSPGQPSSGFNNHLDPLTGVAPRLASLGPIASGGTPVQFLPYPALSGSNRSSLHFLVGGSGGGAAASNAALALSVAPGFAAGAGGGGGGGAISLRAGDELAIAAAARVLANGGTAGSVIVPVGATAAPAPGGGGSGGSCVLQSGNGAAIAGEINVLGGAGGIYDRAAGGAPPLGAHVRIFGGDGSPGFVRFETPSAPNPAMLPNAMPPATAANVGMLNETDDLVSATSHFYDTRLPQSARFRRYEIVAMVDGTPVLFSDDPAVSSVRAGDGAALRAYFQAGLRGFFNQSVAIGPWRTAVQSSSIAVGIDAESDATMFRFRVVQDRAIAAVVEIESVRVIYDM